MKRSALWVQVLVVFSLCAGSLAAQQTDSNPAIFANDPSAASRSVPRLIMFSGTVKDLTGKPLTGPVELNFAIYKEQADAAPLWQESETLNVDEQGHYTALLGAMQAEGLPVDLFTSGEARWLGVSAGKLPEQPRTLLVSVPYALKANDAEMLAGRPASAYALAPPAGASTSAGAATAGATAPGGAARSELATPGKPKSGPKPNVVGTGTQNYIPLWTDSAGTLGNSVMYQSGSNIGIGTTPGVALDVYGASAGLRLSGTGTHQVTITGATSGRLGQDSSGFFFSSDTNGAAIRFGTNNGSGHEWMRITSAGKVGIGTTAPGHVLDVVGDINASTNINAGGNLTVTGTITGNGSGLTNIPNSALANSSISLSCTGLTCDPSVPLGGTLHLTATGSAGVASFNNRTGAVLPQSGDYGFGQISGTVTDAMLANSYSGTGSCSSGQVVAGLNRNGLPSCVTAGTITGVNAGTGLLGGGSSGTVTLNNTGILSIATIGGLTHGGDPQNPTLSIAPGGVTNAMLANAYAQLSSTNTFNAEVFITPPSGTNALNATATGGVTGVIASSDSSSGLAGLSTSSTGVYGYSGSGYAGHFVGNLSVTGAITAGTKDFKIDHPLDPADRYLYHASVESSEMMNIYTGNVVLDAGGGAVVQLPDWFESLNTDFRYQLTAIGAPGPNLHIAQEVQGNSFRIAGGNPGMKVSWQVTGVRQDVYAKAHPLQVEVDKPESERGYYIHPELYGAPPEKSIEWVRNPEVMKRIQEMRQSTRGPEAQAKPKGE